MPYQSRLPRIAAELTPAMDAVVEATADLVAKRAKERVPVGSGEVHLRDRIHVEEAGPGARWVFAGDNEAFYGHIVEHGSAHSAPRPFLVPAAEETRGDIVGLGVEAIRAIT